jgi:hypothetical protein
MPENHPYCTLEDRLPLSYTESKQGLNPLHLNTELTESADEGGGNGPVLSCPFCDGYKTFKQIVGYWAHLRNKHEVHTKEERLEQMKRAGDSWREHMEYQRSQGRGGSLHDPTWLKLEQMKEGTFSWEVVTSWKLR